MIAPVVTRTCEGIVGGEGKQQTFRIKRYRLLCSRHSGIDYLRGYMEIRTSYGLQQYGYIWVLGSIMVTVCPP